MKQQCADGAFMETPVQMLAADGMLMQGIAFILLIRQVHFTACRLVMLINELNSHLTWQVLPGGRVLATADETGLVAAVDIRMLGGSPAPSGAAAEAAGSRAVLWRCRQEGGGVTCLTSGIWPAAGDCHLGSSPWLVQQCRLAFICTCTACCHIGAGLRSITSHTSYALSSMHKWNSVIGTAPSDLWVSQLPYREQLPACSTCAAA